MKNIVDRSLPSRGAWIEMELLEALGVASFGVAPLAGSVDRNGVQVLPITDDQLSLPSRGAWIEICPRRHGAAMLSPSLPSRGAWIEMAAA